MDLTCRSAALMLAIVLALSHSAYRSFADDAFTLRIDGRTLTASKSGDFSKETVLLWRKYHLKNGWVANCCPLALPESGRIAANSSMGLVAEGSLDGLGKVTMWLADTDAPYKPISNAITNARLLKGVGFAPATIDTGSEFTVVDTNGKKIVSKGKFIATGNSKNNPIKYYFTGKTEDGTTLGGAQIDGENWVGLYVAADLKSISKTVEAHRCKALEGAQTGLIAKHRSRRSVVIELHKKARK